ncbi:MAG: lipoyl(octanoyl) transferase [Phycisphaeraceae bacterium]
MQTAIDHAAVSMQVLDLGRMAYAAALETQRQRHAEVLAGAARPTLLLVEHDPVITLGQRRGVGAHLLASRDHLATLGIDVQETDRGGDITYHGPGQLVAYPILRLSDLGFNVGRYMRWLEEVVIQTVAAWGVTGVRVAGHTGVWVEGNVGFRIADFGFAEPSRPSSQTRMAGLGSTKSEIRNPKSEILKLCAMGVRVRRNVTLHGLALNVRPDLSHFATIVPCGLADRGVTSLHQLLGEHCPTMEQVKAQLVRVMQEHFGHFGVRRP